MLYSDIPYGGGHLPLRLEVPSAEILASRAGPPAGPGDPDRLVRAAMAAPIGAPTLAQLARGKRTATVIISDHTRPVPSRHILPHMLAELRAGSPGIDITLLVATGFHRGTTPGELEGKLGRDIMTRERIVVHDCRAGETHVDMGRLPSGARLVVNRAAAETELLAAEGFIEPHFFAGFSGGRKSVLPGVCGRVTVLGNHCAAFIDSPYARAGVLDGNPMHRDMLAACRMVGLRYIVNVTLDGQKRVAAAFAGDPEAAHRRGCDTLAQYCRVKPRRPGDIVVTSNGGAPLDQNVYQAVKGMTAAEAAAREGAVIIMCAQCLDGTGSDDLFQRLRDCESPRALLHDILKVPMDETRPDQWEYQILARVLARHPVIFVSRPEMREPITQMKMTYAPSLEAALEIAWRLKGRQAHHVVIPDGVSVVVERQNEPA